MSEQEQVRGEITGRRLTPQFLDPATLTFSRSPRGTLRVELPDRCLRAITVVRLRPLQEPERYLALRTEDGEAGIVRDLRELPSEQRSMILEEVDKRYFRPVITRVRSVGAEGGEVYWDVDTDRGRTQIKTASPRDSVTTLDDGRYLVTDLDKNRYEIRGLGSLDARSQRLVRDVLG